MTPEAAPGPEYVMIGVDGHVATVTVDNPPVNALSRATLDQLEAAMDRLAADERVRVVVVTGAGSRAFVAGADIRELAQVNGGQDAMLYSARGQALFNRIEGFPKPVIAAIDGACLGGGLELAMACHVRVAGARARLGLPEITLGIIPGFGGTQRLPRIVGRSRGLELLLTGDTVGAEEAQSLGLVDRVAAEGEGLKAALDLARQIAGKSQAAVRLILEAVREGLAMPLGQALDMEAEKFGLVLGTPDAREGLAAFLEKRPPKLS